MDIQEYIEAYVKLGLKPIPIRRGSKKPIQKNWNRFWSKTAVIEISRRYPDCNLGILLGNVIDIESDTPEGNQLLDGLLSDVSHPVYRSLKSKHHLFVNPYAWLTRIVIKGIEFRGYKHHSVLPPSIHASGTIYTWLTSSVFPIPPLPKVLSDMLVQQIPKRNRHKNKSEFVRPWCSVCEKKVTVRKSEYEIEIKHFDGDYQCRKCRKFKIPVGRRAKVKWASN